MFLLELLEHGLSSLCLLRLALQGLCQQAVLLLQAGPGLGGALDPRVHAYSGIGMGMCNQRGPYACILAPTPGQPQGQGYRY